MCGFVGIIGVERAAPMLGIALQAIQHRGQDAAGIGTVDDDGRFHLHKDLGQVSHAVPRSAIEALPGGAGIGHVRYPTAGGNAKDDAQPFITRRPGLLMAHNGNVTNTGELTRDLKDHGLHVLSTCDVETILLVLADELTRLRPSGHTTDDLLWALGRTMKRVKGAYTVTTLLEVDGRLTLVAFRDPHGIRPGILGRRDDGSWMVASESVALDALGYERVGDLKPGHAVLLRPGELAVEHEVAGRAARHCIFEQIYFARPDSMMDGGRVYTDRWRLGEKLAAEWQARGLKADVVIPVPDTSRPAASAMAEQLGLPYREGFIKNRYSGRTFIMPDERTRESALRLKLNPIREEFEGKHVVLVDDSIVRGATMRRIVRLVRGLNPASIHIAIFSPPVRHPCFYGIDMPSPAELVASGTDRSDLEAKLIEHLGCDSVTYLTVEGLQEVAGKQRCTACFTGEYIVPLTDEERAAILADRRG